MKISDLSVLLVEDSLPDRLITRAFLREIGVRKLVESDNGADALFRLENMKFDLVLLDWQMPQMNGITFFKNVRFDRKHKDLPIVFLTGLTERKDVEEAISQGVTEYLVKPLSAATLKARIAKLFSGVEFESAGS